MFRPNHSRIPTGIWILGFVSLLMDVSSEMVHSLLPLFMVTTLGASALMVGLLEGLAEATALIVKVFSGVLSDWFGRRKGLALIGYGLGFFERLPRAWQVPFALALFALQVRYSRWWLQRFRFGPAEWLWRSITYWRLQPMRLPAPVLPSSPPPLP